MAEASVETLQPYFDPKEQRLIDEIRKAGGDMFRDELRKNVRGSNTTFIRKLTDLKKKGIIEEYKKVDGRLKTAYRLTAHARTIFDVAHVLRMRKWFSASQKIELFPEFEHMAQVLTGNGSSVYKMLGIDPQHVSLETSLAANESPPLKEEEVRETLSMCNAVLQNVVTTRLHPRFEDDIEGYIIFHYKLEKPREEIQRLLPECILKYVTAADPLEQHRATSKLVELTIRYPSLLPTVTMTALNIVKALGLKNEGEELLENYRACKNREEPQQVNRVRAAVSALKIFETLYETHQRKASDGLLPAGISPASSRKTASRLPS